MSDYPDYTSLLQIIGSDIMVPIDLQGAYIMMPVDIQAQYVTLDIDIVAQSVGDISVDIAAQSVGNITISIAASTITLQVNIASITGGVAFNVGTVTGTVNVNLASSAITLNVDIKAQTIGNLTIDIEAQSVAIIDQPNWSAINATDKNFTLADNDMVFGEESYGSYTVTTGKTLFICGASFWMQPGAAASGDLPNFGYLRLHNNTDNINLAALGGNGGGGIVFSKPIALAAGKVLRYVIGCMANHTCSGWLTVWGYEI